MARHRKIKATQHKHARGLAVLAFLGLSVVSAPVAAATTDESSSSSGPSATAGSASGAGTGSGGAADATDNGGTDNGNAGPGGSPSGAGDSPGSEDNSSDADESASSAGSSTDPTDPTDATESGTESGTSTAGSTGSTPTQTPAGSTPTKSPTEPETSTEPAAPTAPAASAPTATPEATPSTAPAAEAATQPQGSASSPPEGAPAAPTVEAAGLSGTAGTAQTMSMLAEPTADVAKVAQASSLVIDPYGLPPNPFETTDPGLKTLNGIGQFIESIFPAYPTVVGTTPVSLAVTVVNFLGKLLAGTQVNGENTIFSLPIYVLFAAAYQRLIDIGTNTLATAKVTETSQLLNVVTLKLDIANPDDVVYLPQLAGVTAKGAWVYEPISHTIVYTTLDPGLLANGGTDTISFTIDDSLGYLAHPIGAQSVTFDFTVPVNRVITINQLPYFSQGAHVTSTNQGTGVVTGTVLAVDPDGGPVTYSGTALLGTGTVTVAADGTWTFTPSDAARHAASIPLVGALVGDTVVITATDADGGVTLLPATALVDIVPKNAPPTASLAGALTQVGLSYTGSLNSHDADGDTLFFTAPLVTGNLGGVLINPLNGDFVYTPVLTAWLTGGSDSFVITVADGHGGTATVTVPITIAVNGTPDITEVKVTSTNSSSGVVTGTVTSTDPEGDAVTYTGSTLWGTGTVTVTAGGVWTYTPSDDARHAAATLLGLKTETVYIDVTDSKGASPLLPTSVTVTIVPQNAAPTIALSGSPSLVGLTYTGSVTAADPDSDFLSYSGSPVVTSKGGTVLVNALNGDYAYTPLITTWFTGGSDSFVITVSDGHGGSASVTVPITVAVNHDPSFSQGATVTGTNSSTGVVTGTSHATDPDGDTVTYTGSTFWGTGTVTVNATGGWTYGPSDDARHAASTLLGLKSDTVTITAADGKGGTKTSSVTVTIVPQNAAPTIALSGSPSLVGLTYTGAVTAADPDSDSLSFSGSPLVTSKGGTVLVNAFNGSYAYTPLITTWLTGGSDSFVITVADGHGGSASVTVPITVAVNHDPSFSQGATVTGTNSSTGLVTGTSHATDPDGDTVTYTGSTFWGRGTVAVATDGSWTFTPTADARHAASATVGGALVDSETVTITAADGKGGTKTSSVTVSIVPKNAAPTGTVGGITKTVGTYYGSLSVSDADGDSTSFSPVAGTGNSSKGTFTVNALNGNFSYTPFNVFINSGSDTFTIHISDGHGGSTPTLVTIAFH